MRVKTYEVTVELPDTEDATIQTFDVTVEEGLVILHA
jgi:hypothetical protein